MKGLIRNNFYNVAGSLKATLLTCFIAMIGIAIIGIYFPNNTALSSGLICGMLGAFGALSGTAIQKDGTSKWNTFELTMPISRIDVIRARYLSFILYILIGLSMAVLSSLFNYAVTGTINLERVGFGFAFGIAFATSIPTFMTPLNIIFGSDKNELFLILSAAMGLGLFFGVSVMLTPFLSDFSHANFVFRLGYFIFSILLFGASYTLSVFLDKRKEL